jgi:hypothetical protein
VKESSLRKASAGKGWGDGVKTEISIKTNIMNKYFLIIILLISGSVSTLAQSLFEPNYALKNPMTLEIVNIELKDDMSLLNISIENLAEGGFYCIDPLTYIITDKGEKFQLTDLSGLPLCPEVYKFSRVGEIKYISMRFPPIAKDTEWLDIIEECSDNCLAIYGLCLDIKLNTEINIAFRDIENGRMDAAINKFEEIKESLKGKGNPIQGSVYINLISLYEEKGNSARVAELKNELQGLLIPHKEKFIALVK